MRLPPVQRLPESLPTRFEGWRSTWTASLLAFWLIGYFLVGNARTRTIAPDLATSWDHAIPFWENWIWVYLGGILMVASPILTIPTERQFLRVAKCYALAIGVALMTFTIFPVSSRELRAGADGEGLEPLASWALHTLRAVDPPVNLFPSLHVALCGLAAFAVAEARPRWRWAAYGGLVLVAMSTTVVKQHLVLDAVGGIALASAVWRWSAAGGESKAAAWHTPLAYVALVIVYMAFGLSYLLAA